MGLRLQVEDALDIDDCRTMDTDKADRCEPLGKLLQRGPVQHFRSADVQARVNSGGFNPVDINHTDERG